MEREKKTYSGPLLEADFYPVFSDGRRIPTRAPKTKASTTAQKKYNQTQAIKKFIRLINANFDNNDYFMHPTYIPENAPQTEKEARRDIVNYLRRVKNKRTSEANKLRKSLRELRKAIKALPDNTYLHEEEKKLKKQIAKLEKPFKYAYVIEKQEYKRGSYVGRTNWHFHLFLTGGLDDKTLEGMWTNGIRTNCNNFQPDKFGPEAAAVYMSKDPQGSKRFSCSRNLDKPIIPPPKDGRISRRGVEKLATERIDDAPYWEKRYKGYKFIRCFSRYNEYNGHWYVTAIMYKCGGAVPQWKEDEWITSDYTN